MPTGPLALADVGCGDGPFFALLHRMGFISAARPVYAVDLQPERLQRVVDRFPFIVSVAGPVESVPSIPSHSLDFVISTMVMEHVPDEEVYLNELRRLLRPGGRAYLTTVFKRKWAWYFRRRNGQPVLDVSHIREYTDLSGFEALLMKGNRFASVDALELEPLWFPLIDPFLFVAVRRGYLRGSSLFVRLARFVKVPIPGYYTLSVILRA